ncbi:MAG: prepilin-type N-terminal cleavage/methylation domain-containing protein [Candidatus Liptonbacteria bacterium]|nr:prepilin-type N-terminal cleavage/methylation domain-containing protein [Candidatus Liptonbacteria bacterium]
MKRLKRGFTLIELLVVMGIIAIISAVVVVVINPIEILREGRDARRIAEVGTLNRAINLYLVQNSNPDLGVEKTIYISLPDPSLSGNATNNCSTVTGLPKPPPNWSYRCVSRDNLQKIDGKGWLPLDFINLAIQPPISNLPIDPVNTAESGNYYAYVASNQFAVTAALESEKRLKLTAAADGGTDRTRIEMGSDLALWTKASGLVGYWNFDEGSGTTANDSSGNTNTGTLTNMELTDWVDGKQNKALSFDGVNEYVSLGSNASLAPTDITVEAWFKLNTLGVNQVITSQWWWSAWGRLRVTSGNALEWTWVDSLEVAHSLTSSPLSTGVWYHAAITFNKSATTAKLYLDGQEVDFEAAPNIERGLAVLNAYIGVREEATFGEYFNGAIDEVRVYNRALSASEISSLYSATR